MSLRDIQASAKYHNAQLIAVSKKQPDHMVQNVLDQGHRVFGENRVQEATQRWAEKRDLYSDLTLHLIGPLQTNKVKQAVALFDVIHTLEREKLADKLSQEMQAQNRNLPCFIQINTGDEAQKSGIAPNELTDFLAYCTRECTLQITGLMCIPPFDDNAPSFHFALLKKLARRHHLPHLSMGMSGDYDRALRLGATHIRVGSAIFGERL